MADTDLTPKKEQALDTMKLDNKDLEAMYGGLEQEDVSIPRIVILQGLSPEVSEGRGKPGEFFIKGLERNLGSKPLEIVVLMRNKSRIRWQDLNLGGGILCRSIDAKIGTGDPGGSCEICPLSEWTGTGKPACDLYQNLIVVLRQDEDWFPMALSGNRTKLKALKNLNSLLITEMAKGRPLCSKSYLLESLDKTNSKNLRYFSYRVSPANNNAMIPIEEQRRALNLFGSLKGKKIEIVQDQDTGEETEAPAPSKEY